MQYSDGLYERTRKVAEVYDEPTQNDILIEGVSYSICYSLWKSLITHQHAEVIYIIFEALSKQTIQKHSVKHPTSDNQAAVTNSPLNEIETNPRLAPSKKNHSTFSLP